MAGTRTNGDAVGIIQNEGLDYAVRHYIDGEEFKDPETARLWKLSDACLSALVEHLKRETGQEDFA